MKEVFPNLFVGSQNDYEYRVRREQGWRVVHACKEPYHRRALGYKGRATSKDHPEYLVARRGDRLILNFIDADDPAYVPREMVGAAIKFIHESLTAGYRVLVHCNQGESRGPSVALLYLLRHTDKVKGDDFPQAEAAFRKLYPAYAPKRGVRMFLANEFRRLKAGEQSEGTP